MHTNTGTAHRDHRSNLLQGKEGHPLEEHTQLGVLFHEFFIHVGVLGASRYEHGNPIYTVLPLVGCPGNGTVLCVLVTIVVLHQSETRHQVQKVVKSFFCGGIVLLPVHLMELLVGPMLSHAERV